MGSGSAAHGLDDVAEAEHASLIVVGSERHGARRRSPPARPASGCCTVRSARSRSRRAASATGRRIRRSSASACPSWTRPRRRGAPLRGRAGQGDRREADALHRDRAPRRVFSPVIGPRRRGGLPRNGARGRPRRAGQGARRVARGVEATEELLEGDTVDALAALDEHEIDLLVCGSRGYGPVRRVLLGGVLRKLVRRAACPSSSCREAACGGLVGGGGRGMSRLTRRRRATTRPAGRRARVRARRRSARGPRRRPRSAGRRRPRSR